MAVRITVGKKLRMGISQPNKYIVNNISMPSLIIAKNIAE